MGTAVAVGNIRFLAGAICGVLVVLAWVQLPAPHNEVHADEGARRLLSPRQLMTAAQQKAEAKKLSKLALASANEVLSKIVVPTMNKIIPQQIQKVGDDPMAQVVKSKTITVTDLAGLQYASIETITASKLAGNTQFESGLAETITATMELEGTVTQPMTANGVLQIGSNSSAKDKKTNKETKDTKRRLLAPRQLKDGIKDGITAAKDGAKATSKSLQGASGSYQMSFTNVKLKMPMTGTIQVSAGVNLSKPMMSNLVHLTIQSITNGNPSVSMDTKLGCPSAMDMDCHTANAAIGTAKPLIDMEIGDHAKSIVQNIIDKVLPMVLGQKTNKTASGTIQGHMKLSRAASSTRRLQQPIGPSPPGTCDEGSVPCGGKCLAGKPTDICCLDASGAGIVCGQYARCEKGVCLAPNGVNGSCRPDEIKCGDHCLVGKPTDKCCLGSSGAGIVCGPNARCDKGFCLADDGVGEACPAGEIKCGKHCLAGKPTDTCCLDASGTAGIVCGQYARCVNGICLADDGVNESCPPGEIKCGKLCLVGKATDTCCVGSTGYGIVCGPTARCDNGICLADDGVGESCPPGEIKCGKHCLAGKPTDTCCLDSSGTAGIVCGQDARCEKGVCLAPNGVNGSCDPGEIKCGDHCLAGKPTDKCCLGPSGAGIVCGQYARCDKGVCLADDGVGESCPSGEIKCGKHCLAGKPTDICCLDSSGSAGIVCGADAHCKSGVCLAGTSSATSSPQTEGSIAGTTSDGTTREAQLSDAISKALADAAGVPPETVIATVSDMGDGAVSVTYGIKVPPEANKDVFEAIYKILRKDDDEMSELIGNHLQGLQSDLGNLTVVESDARVLNPMLVPEISTRGIPGSDETGSGQFPWWIVILAAVLMLLLIAGYCMRRQIFQIFGGHKKSASSAAASDSSDEGEREALTSSRPGTSAGPSRELTQTQKEPPQQRVLPPTMQLSQVMQGQPPSQSQSFSAQPQSVQIQMQQQAAVQPQTMQMQPQAAQYRMMPTQLMQAPTSGFVAVTPQTSLAQAAEFCKECGAQALMPGAQVCPMCGTRQ